MKEIICVHLGQAGIQIGVEFWTLMLKEHHINFDGTASENSTEDLSSMFSQTSDGKYIPRAVFADWDPTTINQLVKTKLGKMLKPSQMIEGNENSCSNFAKAIYYNGKKLTESLVIEINKQVDDCENINCLAIFNGLNGGTGSAIATALISEYYTFECGMPRLDTIMFSVWPSNDYSDSQISTISFIHALSKTKGNWKLSVIYDNQAIFKICNELQGIISPNIKDVNKLISLSASLILAGIRFGSSDGYNITTLSQTLVPYPDLHFVSPSFSPFASLQSSEDKDLSTNDITKEVMKQSNCMTYFGISEDDEKYKQHKSLGAAFNFRGDVNESEIVQTFQDISMNFVNSHSQSYSSHIIIEPWATYDGFVNSQRTVCMLNNSTQIWESLRNNVEMVEKFIKENAYLSTFCAEGMEYSWHDQSVSDVKQIITDYEELLNST